MAIYRVQAPDGTVLRIEGPDNATEDQLTSVASQQYQKQLNPNPTDQSVYPQATPLNNFLAGVGKGMVDMGRGIGERVGLVSPQDVDASRKVDAPLVGTTAGSVGDLTGNLALAAPTAFIPGANTIAGAAAIGAGLGAVQPTGDGESAGRNAFVGGALGGVGQAALGGLAALAGNRLNAAQNAASQMAAKNATRDTTLQSALDAGYKLPPSQANPSLTNHLLEGFAGKISTAQSAANANQPITDSLIVGDLGLSPTQPITREALAAVRAKAGNAYQVIKQAGTLVPDAQFKQQIANLGGPDYAAMLQDFPELANSDISDLAGALDKPQFSANSAVSLMKQLRNGATGNFRAAKISGDPTKLALAGAQDDAASAIEDLVDRTLTAQGNPQAVQQFRDARTLIAKTHDAERALNSSTGSFDAGDYGKLFDKGRPLSGGSLAVGRTAAAYPKALQEIKTSTPGISPLDYAASLAASVATHNPSVMASVLGRPIARAAILSAPYQKAFVGPQGYAPSLLTRAAPPTLLELQKLGVSGLLGGSLPSIYAPQQ